MSNKARTREGESSWDQTSYLFTRPYWLEGWFGFFGLVLFFLEGSVVLLIFFNFVNFLKL